METDNTLPRWSPRWQVWQFLDSWKELHLGKICRSEGQYFYGDIVWSGLFSNILFQVFFYSWSSNIIFELDFLSLSRASLLILLWTASAMCPVWERFHLTDCKRPLGRFAFKSLQLCFIEKLSFCSIKNFVYPLSVHHRLESYNHFIRLKQKN